MPSKKESELTAKAKADAAMDMGEDDMDEEVEVEVAEGVIAEVLSPLAALKAQQVALSAQIRAMEVAEAEAAAKAKESKLVGFNADLKAAMEKAMGDVIAANPEAWAIADGIWYSRDKKAEAGLVVCGVIRKAVQHIPRTPKGEGDTKGNGSYVAGYPPSPEMLARHGSKVYFAAATEVTIDKATHIMPAGMTFNEAHKFSNNGGWRNRVRMALGKLDTAK